jgi:threonyl-tRNA synthetase
MIVAKRIKDKIVDLSNKEIGDNILSSTEEGIDIVRHSAAHLLAQAVQELFPKSKKAIGPTTKDGFFYDLDIDHNISEHDLELIENRMKSIVEKDIEIVREEISKKDAIKIFKDLGEIYKVEILNNIDDENVTIYRQGSFVDLCRGPHVPRTSYIKNFKLNKVSGAYWKGDSKNKMLQRIYGLCFDSKKELKDYIEFLKEVEKRDHRKLGRELNLFFTNRASVGSTFWLPKGMTLRRAIEDFSKNLSLKNGYQEIKGPTIMSSNLWEQSGHLSNYRENMYETSFEDETLLIKPMNCPGHILMYKNAQRSYKELPIRFFELGNVFRRELSGALHGLMRQREFTQDDAHIFISEDMIEDEIKKILDLVDYTFKSFGFSYSIAISTRPENFIGTVTIWNKATESLKKALESSNYEYTINEGDGSFYGPKIDYQVKDAIGRSWQCATIQLDFNLPERFQLDYTDSNGEKVRPIMIHRAIYGSIERFIGILIEHYEGKFPLWIAPIQAAILTISDKTNDYAKNIKMELDKRGIRSELNISSDRISQKIKKASLEKIPLQIVLGEEEAKNNSISLRSLGSNSTKIISIDELESLIKS